MRQLFPVASTTALAICSCAPDRTSYPPPEQYQRHQRAEPPLLVFGIPNADARVLADVVEEESPGRRWTHAHPRFSFQLHSTEDLDLYMRLDVHSDTFARTGPVTLTIRVGGEVIDRPRYESPGVREYSHPVPSRLLARNPVIVAIDVDPPWEGEDKVLLGIGLYAIGFTERDQ